MHCAISSQETFFKSLSNDDERYAKRFEIYANDMCDFLSSRVPTDKKNVLKRTSFLSFLGILYCFLVGGGKIGSEREKK